MLTLGLLKVIASLHFHSAMAASNEQYYRIKVPVNNLTCEQEAANLGSHFREITGKAPTESKCSGQSRIVNGTFEQQLFILDLRYLAEGKAKDPIHSSYYGNSFFDIYKNNLHGMYSDLKSCLNELQYRTLEFETHTHKAALASTCEQATSQMEQSYVIRIDTFGVPEIGLFSTEDLTQNYDENPFNKAIEKIILTNNGQIVGHTKGHYYYYSKNAVKPQFGDFGEMHESDCRQQLVDLQKMMRDLNQNEITLGCSHLHQTNGYTVLRAVWNDFTYFESYYSEEHYADFNECDRDKSRVLAKKNADGFRVKNALCRVKKSVDESNEFYLMDLYY
ncbi:MAG: hypothetical protein ACXVCY_06620 [Pseudobdellovibrionaceae bacterium]